MRKLAYFTLLMLSSSAYALTYPDTIVLPLNHLDITDQQKMKASEAGMQKYGWQVTKKSDKVLEGDLQGRGQSRVEMEAGENSITLKFLTKEDMTNYKFYRRLLSIRADTYKDLLNCTSDTYRLNPAKTEVIRNMRAAVFAIAKYQWHISEISESKIVSSLPAKGRLEAEVINGDVKFKFWDEINRKYEGDDNGYVQRVNSIYQSQLVGCNVIAK